MSSRLTFGARVFLLVGLLPTELRGPPARSPRKSGLAKPLPSKFPSSRANHPQGNKRLARRVSPLAVEEKTARPVCVNPPNAPQWPPPSPPPHPPQLFGAARGTPRPSPLLSWHISRVGLLVTFGAAFFMWFSRPAPAPPPPAGKSSSTDPSKTPKQALQHKVRVVARLGAALRVPRNLNRRLRGTGGQAGGRLSAACSPSLRLLAYERVLASSEQ